jgi:L-histidine Nalpha-methyltransferase
MSTPHFDVLSLKPRPSTGQDSTTSHAEFARAVCEGLTKSQRELPSRYLYDDVGSALYEAITVLPEYGLTRADERLLRRHASSLLTHLPPDLLVAELGSGSGRKTRWILEAISAQRTPVHYFPIDISLAALQKCRQELSGLGAISLVGLEGSFLDGLQEVVARRREGQTLLVLFLGSTIGNFERPAAEAFLKEIRRRLQGGDALLLGTDLEKPADDLLLAYDDPLGVTAAFNRNLLARINRELDGDFIVQQFAHDVRYDPLHRRIEMHLRADRRHTVCIPKAPLTCAFEADETIWTEACHKFNLDELDAIATRTGFLCEAQWVDGDWPFAESLWIAD